MQEPMFVGFPAHANTQLELDRFLMFCLRLANMRHHEAPAESHAYGATRQTFFWGGKVRNSREIVDR